MAEQKDASDLSHLVSLNNLQSAQVNVLHDMSSYGASVGGSAFDSFHHIWYVGYSLKSYTTNCTIVTIHLNGNASTVSQSSGHMQWCTWDLSYDNSTGIVYGVQWNMAQKLQQVVQVNHLTAAVTVVCDLPAQFGNQWGDSMLGDIDSESGLYYVVVDGKDYLSQYLFIVNLKTKTFKQLTINNNDMKWIIPSLTFNPVTKLLTGIGFYEDNGSWQMITVDSQTGAITGKGKFADAASKYVWQYNTIYLDALTQYYLLLTSNIAQKIWYVTTFNVATGQVLYTAELHSSSLPAKNDVPRVWVLDHP